MTLGPITYQNIVDTVKTWIKANCVNITNYAGMSACVKNGYSYQIGSSGSSAYIETAKASLSSQIIQLSASIVDSDMSNFLISVGASSFLNTNVSQDNFFKFISDMVCFCGTKLAYATSQSNNSSTSTVRYLIYNNLNSTYNYKINIVQSSATTEILKANDTAVFLNYIIDLINQIGNNIRVVPCKYTFTLS